MNQSSMSRRRWLKLAGSSLAISAFHPLAAVMGGQRPGPYQAAAGLVCPQAKWSGQNLTDFLYALPDEGVLSVKKALELVDQNASASALLGRAADVAAIQKQLLWVSSNVMAYWWRNETTWNYHELVRWCAVDAGVSSEKVRDLSTFHLEREMQLQIFAKLWDKLTPQQRLELLEKIDPHGDIKNKAGIALMVGSRALGLLAVTAYFSGFAFYTTMSVTISTVAGFFGLTLPFAAYTTASSIVAFLSGPVGWAIIGVATVAGIALTGRANSKKTAAAILQLHALKVAALIESGVPEDKVFG